MKRIILHTNDDLLKKGAPNLTDPNWLSLHMKPTGQSSELTDKTLTDIFDKILKVLIKGWVSEQKGTSLGRIYIHLNLVDMLQYHNLESYSIFYLLYMILLETEKKKKNTEINIVMLDEGSSYEDIDEDSAHMNMQYLYSLDLVKVIAYTLSMGHNKLIRYHKDGNQKEKHLFLDAVPSRERYMQSGKLQYEDMSKELGDKEMVNHLYKQLVQISEKEKMKKRKATSYGKRINKTVIGEAVKRRKDSSGKAVAVKREKAKAKEVLEA